MKNVNETEATAADTTKTEEQKEAAKKAKIAEWKKRIAANVISRAIWDGIKWIANQISEM